VSVWYRAEREVISPCLHTCCTSWFRNILCDVDVCLLYVVWSLHSVLLRRLQAIFVRDNVLLTFPRFKLKRDLHMKSPIKLDFLVWKSARLATQNFV
jgi:hypothetical protein